VSALCLMSSLLSGCGRGVVLNETTRSDNQLSKCGIAAAVGNEQVDVVIKDLTCGPVKYQIYSVIYR
jgi:hypothetical protein